MELKRVSHTHEEIMNYMIAHPTQLLGDVARHFGYTQGWLSQLIHSDAFQEKLKEKQDAVFNHTVLPLKEKMQVVANLALDKLIDQLPMETETSTLTKTAESVLDRLGFTPKGNGVAPGTAPGNTVNINISMDELAEARKLIGRSRASVGVVVDGQLAPIALQGADSAGLGQADPAAHVSAAEVEGAAAAARAEV